MSAYHPTPNPRLIGSTDLASVLGLNPWSTAFELWRRIARGVEERFDLVARRRMETGQLRQDQLAAWWSEDTGRTVRTGPYVERPRDRVWQRVSTDYVVVPEGSGVKEESDEGLEIKLTERIGEGWGEAGTDEIPEHYAIQVQAQCEALGWRRVHVALGWGLFATRYYVVDAVPEIGAALVEAGERFWRDYVVANRPPPLTEVESQRERWAAVRAKYAQPGHMEREATPAEIAVATRLAELRLAEKAAGKAAEPVELELRELLGDYGRVWWGDAKDGSRVTCRPQKPKTLIDWREIATQAGATGELIAAHTKPGTPVRPLRVTLKGQENEES